MEGVHLTRTQESKKLQRSHAILDINPNFKILLGRLPSLSGVPEKLFLLCLYRPGSLLGGIFWSSLVIVTLRMLNILQLLKLIYEVKL